MQAQLIPINGGEPIQISRDVTLVGRKPSLCDLVVNQNSVSKIHCLLVKTDGLLFVRDLSSTNGTKVNGQRITRGALLPGDELAFASEKFRVHFGPGEQEAGHEDDTEMLTGLPQSFDDREENVQKRPEDSGSDSDVRLLPDDSWSEPR